MNFIPLRLGELTVPTLLKFLKTKEKISSTIQPIWISIIFDIVALLFLIVVTLLGALFFENDLTINQISKFSPQENFWILVVVVLVLVTLSVILIYLTSISKKFLQNSIINKLSFETKKFSFEPSKIADNIPNLTLGFTSRILTLSLIIRISKYLALASLFFSLSGSSEPSYRNILIILIGFISAEFFSSLPGSGIMGFGGYELTFQFILSTLNPNLICPLSYITSIHLMGLSVELILATIVVPSCLISAKLTKQT